jgi:hypothetical protein
MIMASAGAALLASGSSLLLVSVILVLRVLRWLPAEWVFSGTFIPDPTTICDCYVTKNDALLTKYMLALYDRKYAGHISVAFDGVAVLG